MPRPLVPPTTRLAELPEGWRVQGCCHCGHNGVVSIAELIERHGNLTAGELAARMRCRCGRRPPGSILAFEHPMPSLPAVPKWVALL